MNTTAQFAIVVESKELVVVVVVHLSTCRPSVCLPGWPAASNEDGLAGQPTGRPSEKQLAPLIGVYLGDGDCYFRLAAFARPTFGRRLHILDRAATIAAAAT